MRMIILPRAAAGVSSARMISRERFAFDLEKFSQWEVSIRLLSFSAGPHSWPLPLPLHTHTHTDTRALEEAFIMDDEEGKKKSLALAFTSPLFLLSKYRHSCHFPWHPVTFVKYIPNCFWRWIGTLLLRRAPSLKQNHAFLRYGAGSPQTELRRRMGGTGHECTYLICLTGLNVY